MQEARSGGERIRRLARERSASPAALKDAALSALIAFGLFLFMIGLRTEQGPSGALEVTTRWPQLAILVGAVFLGSLVRALIFGRAPLSLGRAMPAWLPGSAEGCRALPRRPCWCSRCWCR